MGSLVAMIAKRKGFSSKKSQSVLATFDEMEELNQVQERKKRDSAKIVKTPAQEALQRMLEMAEVSKNARGNAKLSSQQAVFISMEGDEMFPGARTDMKSVELEKAGLFARKWRKKATKQPYYWVGALEKLDPEAVLSTRVTTLASGAGGEDKSEQTNNAEKKISFVMSATPATSDQPMSAPATPATSQPTIGAGMGLFARPTRPALRPATAPVRTAKTAFTAEPTLFNPVDNVVDADTSSDEEAARRKMQDFSTIDGVPVPESLRERHNFADNELASSSDDSNDSSLESEVADIWISPVDALMDLQHTLENSFVNCNKLNEYMRFFGVEEVIRLSGSSVQKDFGQALVDALVKKGGGAGAPAEEEPKKDQGPLKATIANTKESEYAPLVWRVPEQLATNIYRMGFNAVRLFYSHLARMIWERTR